MKHFELWTADLPFLKGSTLKCGRRPVVIVSDDQSIADSSYVSVVPLTKNLESRQLPTCPIRFNGLPVSDERCGQFG